MESYVKCCVCFRSLSFTAAAEASGGGSEWRRLKSMLILPSGALCGSGSDMRDDRFTIVARAFSARLSFSAFALSFFAFFAACSAAGFMAPSLLT